MIPNVDKKNFSTTEAILQQLRNDINNLHYNDQFITEAEVSSRFQVSRTPAREALNILCQEGILEKIPRKGYLIRKLSLQSFRSYASTVLFLNAEQLNMQSDLHLIPNWKKFIRLPVKKLIWMILIFTLITMSLIWNSIFPLLVLRITLI